MPRDFPLGQVTGATAASPATADSCEAANMPGFWEIGVKGRWMNHGPWTNLVLVEILWLLPHRECFSEQTANLYHKLRDTVVLFCCFFFRRREVFGFGRSTLAKLQEHPHCTQMSEGNELSRASLLDFSNHHLTLEMPALSRIIQEMEHPSTSQEPKWMAVS